jgi:hypothetical protein
MTRLTENIVDHIQIVESIFQINASMDDNTSLSNILISIPKQSILL